jgi:hypothetical protein
VHRSHNPGSTTIFSSVAPSPKSEFSTSSNPRCEWSGNRVSEEKKGMI